MRLTKYLLAGAAAFALAIAPAEAGISRINGGGTNGLVASGSAIAGNTDITSSVTTVSLPVGTLVVEYMTFRANAAFTCPNDSAGNVYNTPIGNQQAAPMSLYACWTITTAILPIGSTFTVHSANTTLKVMAVRAYANVNTRDTGPTPGTASANNTAITLTQNTGTTASCPSAPNCSLQLALWSDTATISSVVEDSNYTTLDAGGSSPSLHSAERLVNAANTPAYSASNGTSGTWLMIMLNFSDLTIAPVTSKLLIPAIP